MKGYRFVRRLRYAFRGRPARIVRAERMASGPIIAPELLSEVDGANINGPSLIKVPSWISSPYGKYYLYFAHHKGNHIRLAYADTLEGPWTVYAPGTVHLTDCTGHLLPTDSVAHLAHLASPDVHVDRLRKEVVMYFHTLVYKRGNPDNNKSYHQVTLRATSKDGIQFTVEKEQLGGPYFRVFQWRDMHYAMGRLGILYRSADGVTQFERGPNPFAINGQLTRIRHVGVIVQQDLLHVFYSRFGDRPEAILHATIRLRGNWKSWQASNSQVVLLPEMSYEGADLELETSAIGMSRTRVRQLRDPALFEENGKVYLLYSIAGENGIAIAALSFQ